MIDAQWQRPKPERLPKPTYCPVTLAAGAVLLAAAAVTSPLLLVAGLCLTAVGVTCWINELRHES